MRGSLTARPRCLHLEFPASENDRSRPPYEATRASRNWVAIVDDDPSVRSALSRLLRVEGISHVAMSSALEYLDTCTVPEPACVILDVHLDGMSGFELHDRLLAMNATVVVIYVTAHREISSRELERRVGPHGYLRKPFDTELLLSMVRRALAAQNASGEAADAGGSGDSGPKSNVT